MTNSSSNFQLKCSLFISNLTLTTFETDILSFFSQYQRDIIYLNINKPKHSSPLYQNQTKTAIITFTTHSIAKAAFHSHNQTKLYGNIINITWIESNLQLRQRNTYNLFINKVNKCITSRDFFLLFSNFGDIISCKLCIDNNGDSLGYGYVSYLNRESFSNCIKHAEQTAYERWECKIIISRFIRKNERLCLNNIKDIKHNTISYKNNSHKDKATLYIKNIPSTHNESDLKVAFGLFGKIQWLEVKTDINNRKFAIVAYDNNNAAINAKEKLNEFKWEKESNVDKCECLYVDFIQSKHTRERIIRNKIIESNEKINKLYRKCNLHVRNIPIDYNEMKLYSLFEKFGEIKSVKIPKYTLVTKINNVFKEIPMQKLFGYVCFVNAESALKAINEMNGKFINSTDKRPLLVNHFMPKCERVELIERLHQENMMEELHKEMQLMSVRKSYQRRKFINNKENEFNNNINRSEYELIHDKDDKRDYLGEIIFELIEKHYLSKKYKLDYERVAKITGMILGIDNEEAIIQIANNSKKLKERIEEAISLLNNHKCQKYKTKRF